jgi:hypothetical protein
MTQKSWTELAHREAAMAIERLARKLTNGQAGADWRDEVPIARMLLVDEFDEIGAGS